MGTDGRTGRTCSTRNGSEVFAPSRWKMDIPAPIRVISSASHFQLRPSVATIARVTDTPPECGSSYSRRGPFSLFKPLPRSIGHARLRSSRLKSAGGHNRRRRLRGGDA